MLGIASFAAAFVYRRGFKRIRSVEDVTPAMWKARKIIRGRVTSVGDGDGFHLYHQPRFLAWLPVPKKSKTSSDLSIRLAAVDAPECAHFGKPAQPYGPEAHQYLTDLLLNKQVGVQLLKRDQYGRAVCMVWVKGFWRWKNVPMIMLEKGLGAVYDSQGAEYGGLEDKFLAAQEVAKKKRIGMWSRGRKAVTPMEFKKKHKS